VLSALGLAAAAPRRDVARTVMLGAPGAQPLSAQVLAEQRDALIDTASAALAETPARVRVRYELRYRGQSFELPVEEELSTRPADGDRRPAGLDPEGLRAAFAAAHELRYGYRDEDAAVELVNIRVSTWGKGSTLRATMGANQAPATEVREVLFDGEPTATPVLRGELAAGSTLSGPCLCAMPDTTLLIAPGWSGSVDAHGTIRLLDSATQQPQAVL
jgi:N-methylhydantoinase A